MKALNKIPLCIPYTNNLEVEAVRRVFKSGWLAHGKENEQFCKEFAKYIGVKHAIACNSCTSALMIALEANDITQDVICPSFTFVATANAIVTAGANPVFVDIDPKTNNMDIKELEDNITKRTQAIMPVHYGGLPCNMPEIMKLAKEHNILVIEDSAECIGGTVNGKMAGSFGDIGCFSFFPSKNLTTGEGGMLTTNDDKLAEKMKALLSHGITSSTFSREKDNQDKRWFRDATFAGYNFRMCDILASVGRVQLAKLDDMNILRRKHAKYLISKLKALEYDKFLELPVEPRGYKHVYQMFTIKVDPVIRTEFVKYLNEHGIGANVHFDPPVHKQSFYVKYYAGDDIPPLPNTWKVSQSIVTLPLYPGLNVRGLNTIVHQVKEGLIHCRKKVKSEKRCRR